MQLLRWFIGKVILFFNAVFAPRAVERSPEAQKRVEAALAGLSLYQFHACPFCVKVRRYLTAQGVELPLRDAKSEPFRGELLAQGGKLQVPCLRIEEKGGARWLYESSDIIRFLEERIAGAGR